MVGRIYKVTNTLNGKVYVGATTTSLHLRWRRHKSDARRGSTGALHRAIRKYGPDLFRIEEIESVCESFSALMVAEIRQIKAHNCLAPIGYNMTLGGEGVVSPCLETLEKRKKAAQSLAKDPEWKKAHAATVARLRDDPDWKKSQIEGVHRRFATPGVREEVATQLSATMRTETWKRAQREGSRKRSAKPKWLEVNKKHLRSPEMDALRKIGARRMAANPVWQAAHAEMIRKRSLNPQWKASQAKAREMAGLVRLQKALERDAACSPKERARRVRDRENNRRRRLAAIKKEKQ